MPRPDPLVFQAAREAAESLNDLLQVIICESHVLAQGCRADPETAERALKIAYAAREAANVSRSLFGPTKEPQVTPTD